MISPVPVARSDALVTAGLFIYRVNARFEANLRSFLRKARNIWFSSSFFNPHSHNTFAYLRHRSLLLSDTDRRLRVTLRKKVYKLHPPVYAPYAAVPIVQFK